MGCEMSCEILWLMAIFMAHDELRDKNSNSKNNIYFYTTFFLVLYQDCFFHAWKWTFTCIGVRASEGILYQSLFCACLWGFLLFSDFKKNPIIESSFEKSLNTGPKGLGTSGISSLVNVNGLGMALA
jgi:hypothetical protein